MGGSTQRARSSVSSPGAVIRYVFSLRSVGPVLILMAVACGQSGPPLPPLVKLPAPPDDFKADRRGNDVELQFTVPSANADKSKPANIQRVDVYGVTGAGTITDAELFKYGTRIGSVDVKAPKDPNDTAEPDEDVADVEAPIGKGLDQGARAHLSEEISPADLKPAAIPRKKGPKASSDEGPLLGPPTLPPTRTYLSVGITTKGKRGIASKRVAVPLLPPPAAPAAPHVTYTESAITVAWTATGVDASGVLPSRPLGMPAPTTAFNVYEVPSKDSPPAVQAAPAGGAAPAAPVTAETRLTATPVKTAEYTDKRMTWGTTRCYEVRTVVTVPGAAIESAASEPTCVALADTFPPAAPKQLTAVASEGAISLIWEPNTEADLAGYLVLRGPSADALQAITPAPVAETTFKDTVTPGTHYFYAIEAVDKAGNHSGRSNVVEETAR